MEKPVHVLRCAEETVFAEIFDWKRPAIAKQVTRRRNRAYREDSFAVLKGIFREVKQVSRSHRAGRG